MTYLRFVGVTAILMLSACVQPKAKDPVFYQDPVVSVESCPPNKLCM